MRLRVVDHRHYACAGADPGAAVGAEVRPDRRLPADAQRFWRRWALSACDYAAVATEGGRLVGLFRYYVGGRELTACGTWVDPRYRGSGLGHRLWSLALRRHRGVRNVYVVVTSPGGRALVDSVRRRFRRVDFEVDD